MKELGYLKDMLCEEVKKLTQQNEFTPSTLDAADKIVDMIKDIDEIMEKERSREYMEDASYGYRDGWYLERMPYSNNHSYAYRGNGRINSNYNNSYGNYDNGYSRHTATEKMIAELQDMMNDASSSRDKAVIQKALEELKK